MNEIKVFDERIVLGKEFRIYGTPEDPLFLASDVAAWIEHSKVSMMIKNVDEEEKIKLNLGVNNAYPQDSHGGIRKNTEYWFLTEDGLYEVLMQSRKPIAKAFKKEVKVILKTIRKHGAYVVPDKLEEIIADPDIGIRLLQALKEEQKKSEKLKVTTDEQMKLIEELKPRAAYTERILQSEGTICITQIAKDYGMSGRSMNLLLNKLHIQFKVGDQWVLYKEHQDKGYTESETFEYSGNNKEFAKLRTKWTQVGRLFIYETLKEHGILPMCERCGR